jgi:hypothetical protein
MDVHAQFNPSPIKSKCQNPIGYGTKANPFLGITATLVWVIYIYVVLL